jgi:hypothetical protein
MFFRGRNLLIDNNYEFLDHLFALLTNVKD